MKKAQIASQFLIVVGFAMVIITAFLIGFYSLSSNLQKEKQFIAAQDLALKIKEEILLAQVVSDGYIRTFSLPQNLAGDPYAINMIGNTLLVSVGDANYSTTVVHFNGVLQKGKNAIQKNSAGVQVN